MVGIYALALFLTGAWGVFTSHKLFSARRPWSWRAWLSFIVVLLLVGGSWICAAGLVAGGFAAWMLIPLGVSYLLMLPLPCYFPGVTATFQRRVARNAVFVCFAVALLFLGCGIVPLSWIGL